MAGELLRLCVRCDAHAPAAVRAAMSQLPELGWIVGDAMLVASELVSNAVLHSQGTGADVLTVRITAHGPLRIYVKDPGASGGDARVAERPMELGGMGLRIVQTLATAWGAERERDGYTVWAELPRTSRAPAIARPRGPA